MTKSKERPTDKAWQKIFTAYKIDTFKFAKQPFLISAEQIKAATNNLEPRITLQTGYARESSFGISGTRVVYFTRKKW